MDPFRIQGPAMISFSGGRTSAYMLKQIVDAHGGTLPPDVVVAFANTGLEREETLRFVHECGARWGIPITWLEWRATPAQAERRASLAAWLAAHDPERRLIQADGFERVGLNSASRNGEPFSAVIALKQALPNWQARWCTDLMKVQILFAFARSLGWADGQYAEVIGLRYDEGFRVMKGLGKAKEAGRHTVYPLSKAKVVKADVMRFWLGDNVDPQNLTHPLPQGFDLGLHPWEGNCTLCFMKGRKLKKRLIRLRPQDAPWWNTHEISSGRLFDRRDSIAGLINEVRTTPDLFEDFDEDEYDVECGLLCATGDLSLEAVE